MKKNKFISIILVCCLLVICSISVYAATRNTPDDGYEFTTAYEYKVTPEDEEWNDFTSTAEMIEACKVPEDLVKKMSTKALLDTALDHPLSINALAQNTPVIAYNMLLEENTAFKEFVSRDDMLEVLVKNVNQYNDDVTKKLVLKIILDGSLSVNENLEKDLHELAEFTVQKDTVSGVPHYEITKIK